MNSVTMTTIAVVIWFFVLIIIANLLKKYLQQRDVDWNQFYVLAIFAAFSVITIIMIIYATSPTIDLFTRGGTAEFGQFGDMIGGLLNPIFGFITVLLLLHGAQIQRNDMRRDKNLRDIESLYKLVVKSKEAFVDRVSSSKIWDDTQKRFFKYLDVFVTEKVFYVHHKELITQLTIHAKNEERDKHLRTNNEYRIIWIIADFKRTIKHYEKLLELEDFDYVKEDIAGQLREFVEEWSHLFLLTTEENRAINHKLEPYRLTH